MLSLFESPTSLSISLTSQPSSRHSPCDRWGGLVSSLCTFSMERGSTSFTVVQGVQGWRTRHHCLGSAFLGCHAYLQQPRVDYGGTQRTFVEKVHRSTLSFRFLSFVLSFAEELCKERMTSFLHSLCSHELRSVDTSDDPPTEADAVDSSTLELDCALLAVLKVVNVLCSAH